MPAFTPWKLSESDQSGRYADIVDAQGNLICGVWLGQGGMQGGLLDKETAELIIYRVNLVDAPLYELPPSS